MPKIRLFFLVLFTLFASFLFIFGANNKHNDVVYQETIEDYQEKNRIVHEIMAFKVHKNCVVEILIDDGTWIKCRVHLDSSELMSEKIHDLISSSIPPKRPTVCKLAHIGTFNGENYWFVDITLHFEDSSVSLLDELKKQGFAL